MINRLLPDALSARLLTESGATRRTREGRHAKFPSYYSWCRGPSSRQLARLESVGFVVERYTGFFGHGYYRNIGLLSRMQRRFTRLLLDHPVASLTSFALVVLRRQR